MTRKLLLTLTGQQFSLACVGSGIWPRAATSHATQVQAWGSPQDLQQQLACAAQELSSTGPPARGAIFEALLGQEHARIGLLPVDGSTQELLNGKEGIAFVHAWVKQRLHLDPATQVVRWNVLPHGRSALVTCIPALLLEMLTEFSAQARLRFVSCKPAITKLINDLDGDASRKGQPGAATIVCTEGFEAERRASTIQCLRFEGRHLTSTWRGWVPGSGPAGADTPMQGAVRRFQLAASPQDSEPVMHWHWPTAPMVPALEEVR
jgi:hypothetical protein